MRASILVAAGAAGLLAACGSDSNGSTSPGPQITIVGAGGTGGDSFNGPHANQELRAALLRLSDGALLDVKKGAVAAAGANPAFSLTFDPVVATTAHRIRYWVDFNLNAVCDNPPTDHQWEVDVPAGQTTVNVVHNTTFTNACPTLTFPLRFVATGGASAASFNGPHAGQAFRAGLVRGTATTTVDPITVGTVATAGVDPAFAVTFASRLFIGDAYSVKLMADHNPNGLCDAPPTDHVWSVDIPTGPTTFQTTFNYGHNTTFSNACSFLPP